MHIDLKYTATAHISPHTYSMAAHMLQTRTAVSRLTPLYHIYSLQKFVTSATLLLFSLFTPSAPRLHSPKSSQNIILAVLTPLSSNPNPNPSPNPSPTYSPSPRPSHCHCHCHCHKQTFLELISFPLATFLFTLPVCTTYLSTHLTS